MEMHYAEGTEISGDMNDEHMVLDADAIRAALTTLVLAIPKMGEKEKGAATIIYITAECFDRVKEESSISRILVPRSTLGLPVNEKENEQ